MHEQVHSNASRDSLEGRYAEISSIYYG